MIMVSFEECLSGMDWEGDKETGFGVEDWHGTEIAAGFPGHGKCLLF